MGLASSLEMTKQCVGPEVVPAAVKLLAGATQDTIEAILAKYRAMGLSGVLDVGQVAQLLGEGRAGNHAELVVAMLDRKGVRRIDFFEMFAAMILCAKIPARSKVRNLFDTFDFDHDEKLNVCEVILMLRSTLSAVGLITGGVLPATAGIEGIWRHMVISGYVDAKEWIPYEQWVTFCARTQEVHALGKALDFNKGVCRKALAAGTRAILPPLVVGQADPALAAQRNALAKKMEERARIAREQKRAASAREGKSKFGRSSVLKIKEVFDSISQDGSGYIDEREWRRLTEDTPLAASADTSLGAERQREGQISIVEVLCEVYPFAGDGDVAKMLQWISEEPAPPGAVKVTMNLDPVVAEPVEIAALFQMYDREGNGEMTVRELCRAIADMVGLTVEDVMPMFLQTERTEEDYITASEFADTLMEFVRGDASIQSLMHSDETMTSE